MGKHALLVATVCCILLTIAAEADTKIEDVDENVPSSAQSLQNPDNSKRFRRATYGENRRQRPSIDRTNESECNPTRGRVLPEHCLTSSDNDVPAQWRIVERDTTAQASPIRGHIPFRSSQPHADIPAQSSTFRRNDPSFRFNRNGARPSPQDPLDAIHRPQLYSGYRFPQPPPMWKRERHPNQRVPSTFPDNGANTPRRFDRAVPSASAPAPAPSSSTGAFVSAPAAAIDDDIYVPFSGQRLDAFDWRLVRELDRFARSNAVVSPVGVKMVLGMLHEASSRASAAELRSALGLPVGRSNARDVFRRILQSLQEKQDGFVMRVGNRVFLDQSFEPRMNTANVYRLFYSAEIQSVDFTSPTVVKPIINEWVSNMTNGQINKLITNDLQIANLITMVLNVIYFKGDWLYPFSTQSTTKGSFDISPGKTVEVEYMKLTKDLYYSECQPLDAKMLRLPYKGKKYSMFLILPNKKENFNQMMQLITPALVRDQLHKLQKLEVKVKLPKFVFHYTVHLKELLQKLGISRIFTQSDEINLTKNKTNIMISKVIQKVGLEVNEEGTEATSTTEVHLVNHFGGGQKMFFATHPFLLFVEEEKTGTVVFVGKVMDPSNNKHVQPLKSFGKKLPLGIANILEKDFSEDISVQKTIVKPTLPEVPIQKEE